MKTEKEVMSQSQRDFLSVVEEVALVNRDGISYTDLHKNGDFWQVYAILSPCSSLKPEINSILIQADVEQIEFSFCKISHLGYIVGHDYNDDTARCHINLQFHRRFERSYPNFQMPIKGVNVIPPNRWMTFESDGCLVRYQHPKSVRLEIPAGPASTYIYMIEIPKQDRSALETEFDTVYPIDYLPSKKEMKLSLLAQIECAAQVCDRYVRWKQDEGRFDRLYESCLRTLIQEDGDLSSINFPRRLLDTPMIKKLIADKIAKELANHD